MYLFTFRASSQQHPVELVNNKSMCWRLEETSFSPVKLVWFVFVSDLCVTSSKLTSLQWLVSRCLMTLSVTRSFITVQLVVTGSHISQGLTGSHSPTEHSLEI